IWRASFASARSPVRRVASWRIGSFQGVTMASNAVSSPPWKRRTRSSSVSSMGPIAPDWTAPDGPGTRDSAAEPGVSLGGSIRFRPTLPPRRGWGVEASADLDPRHARSELELYVRALQPVECDDALRAAHRTHAGLALEPGVVQGEHDRAADRRR